MDFPERLTSLISDVEGSTGAALIGLDGLPIKSTSSGMDMESLAAEYASILGDAQKAMRDLTLGKMRMLSVLTDRMNIFFSLLQSEYFLAFTLDNRGGWGRARYRVGAHSRKLEEEM